MSLKRWTRGKPATARTISAFYVFPRRPRLLLCRSSSSQDNVSFPCEMHFSLQRRHDNTPVFAQRDVRTNQSTRDLFLCSGFLGFCRLALLFFKLGLITLTTSADASVLSGRFCLQSSGSRSRPVFPWSSAQASVSCRWARVFIGCAFPPPLCGGRPFALRVWIAFPPWSFFSSFFERLISVAV